MDASAADRGRAVALEINARAASSRLYDVKQRSVGGGGRHTPWRVATAPLSLSPGLLPRLHALGDVLLAFVNACNKLYAESVRGRQPAWVAAYLDLGKPPALVELQRTNKFKSDVPRVIRPDIVVDESGRLTACELDAVPGGIGFTGSMVRDTASFAPTHACIHAPHSRTQAHSRARRFSLSLTHTLQ